MMMRLLALASGVALALASPAAAQSDVAPGDEARDPVRIARLIDELAAPSYPRRAAADRQLAELGATAEAALQAALDSPEPEVRFRASRLLVRHAAEAAWRGPQVESTTTTPATARDWQAEIERQTGVRVAWAGAAAAQRMHAAWAPLPSGPQPLWETLAAAARRQGLSLRPPRGGETADVILHAPPGDERLHALAGPLRMEWRSSRGDDQAAAGRLQLHWLPTLRLAAYAAAPQSEQSSRAVDWRRPSGGQRWLEVPLTGESASAGELVWPLVAALEPCTVELLDFALETQHDTPLGRVELLAWRADQRGTIVAEAAIARGAIAPDLRGMAAAELQWRLLDDAGRAYRVERLGALPGAERVVERLRFTPADPTAVAARLEFVGHRWWVRRDVAFTLAP